MSKKLPAWIVLTVISLVAALALGATYNGTKDRIATQEAEKAVAVRQELLPAAADFKLLTAEDETEVYQGLDASGASVGYVSVGTVTGFGGPVEVTVGMDDEGTIAGVRVGGSNFSETAGLGAKSKEPAFYEQFAGMVYPVDLVKNGGEVDAITAATITSSAVVRGVNDTAKYIAEKAGIKLKEPVVLVQELGDNRYATSKQGFGGPVYVEAEIVDGAITDIVIGDASFNETSGYGAGAKEEKFYSQYVGKSGTGLVLNSDIDQVSGATITSTAVNDAVNLLLLYVNDRAAYEAQLADAPEEVDVSIPDGAQTWTAKGKGLTGTFDVTIAVDENAAVTGIAVGDASTAEDAAFLGQVKNNNAFLAQFIGTTGNIDAAAIDTVTGATISSNGVISAVNKAWNESQGIAEATPAPTAEPTGAEYKTKGQGLTGAFSVWVYVDNGAVTGVKVRSTESEYDEPYLDLVKGNSAFLSQFVGKSGQIAESDIDLVSGATISSQGVVSAVNDALSKAASAPAAEATPAPAAEVAGTEYKAKGQGLTGAFNVTVTLDDNGAVAGVKVGSTESEYDDAYLSLVRGNDAFLSQFVGKTGEVASIDAVTGATISS
ncbi:MAG: RnfABCDGE type electron transport complex subunit G, partial [Clostridia bacterium]|nr:RnfABCDGE type electron transport complex subunit G [Clostridia bacterium]